MLCAFETGRDGARSQKAKVECVHFTHCTHYLGDTGKNRATGMLTLDEVLTDDWRTGRNISGFVFRGIFFSPAKTNYFTYSKYRRMTKRSTFSPHLFACGSGAA